MVHYHIIEKLSTGGFFCGDNFFFNNNVYSELLYLWVLNFK